MVDHWSNASVLVVLVVLAIWHELGLRRLLRRTRRDRVLHRRLRSFWFYCGLVTLLVAVESPIEYWGYHYFYIHMIQHLILLLVAPSLVVAGAPWQPMLLGVPLRLRRPALRAILHEGWARPLRAAGRRLSQPLVVVVVFNIVMVGWQIPGLFDLSERNGIVHSVMNASMLVVGVMFWRLIIASPPLRMRTTPAGQAIALVATNFVMFMLAMSMSVFSDQSWYSVYNHVPGVGLSAFADQQIGAGILWVCGDFWAVPAFIFAIRRLIAQEQRVVGAAIERIFGPGTAGSPGR